MAEHGESFSDEEWIEDPKRDKKRKKSKKKRQYDTHDDDHNVDSTREQEDWDEDEEDDDRPASFFADAKSLDEEADEPHAQQEDERYPDASETDSDPETDEKPEGLTESEAKAAVSAIADGLSRELRSEFEASAESSVEELEAVAVAAFVDALHEKIASGDQDITKEMMDEALQEVLQDLLVVDQGPEDGEVIDLETEDGTVAHASPPSSGHGNAVPPASGANNNAAQVAAATAATVAANTQAAQVQEELAGSRNKRGKGLLVGGVVGYIVGHRHGLKRAQAELQPEIDVLEEQIAELYDALALREEMIRQVVHQLGEQQLGNSEAIQIASYEAQKVGVGLAEQREASKKVSTSSVIIPALLATLLVSKRLMKDVSDERFTWGKDMLVGGLAGYMVGRRRGRQKAEKQIKTEMEQLEDRVQSLQGDMIHSDAVIDAMVRVSAEADHDAAVQQVQQQAEVPHAQAPPVQDTSPSHEKDQPSPEEKQLVDASIDRIASSRKNRELKRHKLQLIESGKPEAVGKLNLVSSVFLERRLIDGTENSSTRKPIENMDESELLAMSHNIYVDGESAIDLYEHGRVDKEVLRESVIQFWRKTGNYEQTLRVNLKPDESVVNDIRADLEKAYRAILNDPRSLD